MPNLTPPGHNEPDFVKTIMAPIDAVIDLPEIRISYTSITGSQLRKTLPPGESLNFKVYPSKYMAFDSQAFLLDGALYVSTPVYALIDDTEISTELFDGLQIFIQEK